MNSYLLRRRTDLAALLLEVEEDDGLDFTLVARFLVEVRLVRDAVVFLAGVFSLTSVLSGMESRPASASFAASSAAAF